MKITKVDIINISDRLGMTLSETEIDWVLLSYEDAQRQDPTGTWNLVVEDLIYQAIEIRKREEAEEESEETRRDFGNDDYIPENHTMTKDTMILTLYAGFRVRHKYFSPNEWMKLTPNGDYEFEDGVVCTPQMFWMDRKQDYWKTDWEIVKE